MINRLYRIVKNNRFLYALYSLTLKKILITYTKMQINKRRKDIKHNGIDIIGEIDQHINNCGIPCFVDSGTLLGTVREGRLLSWDYDIDFGIMLKSEQEWDAFENYMKQIGYSKARQFKYDGKITEQTYRRGATYIDFFNHYSDYSHSYYNAYIRKPGFVYKNINFMHPLRYKTVKIKGLSMRKLGAINVHVPSEPEEYLVALYGEDWRIPNPNWVEDGNLPTCEFLPGFGECEKF